MKTPLALVGLSLALGACDGEKAPPEEGASPCGPVEGVVVRVLDGDTVDLASGIRLRYLLVDAPEIAHNASEDTCCFGDESRLFNESLVLEESVGLEYDEECQDRYGRTLAYVKVGDRMVNRILVERGYARVEVFPPNQKYEVELRALEESAKAASAGLWGACPDEDCPMGAF